MAALGTNTDLSSNVILYRRRVRRLTPREFERLQGFADDYTRIAFAGKPPERCPDGPRYQACGNSIATPVMAWLGERISIVDSL